MASCVNATSGTAELERVWALADRLFHEHVGEEAWMSQPIDLRHPFLFYIGHLAAFAWNKTAPLLHLKSFAPQFDVLFERGIDPDVDDPQKCHDHPDVPDTWPPAEQVLAYRDRVRKSIRECGHEAYVLHDLHEVLDMVVEHDLMHIETLYYMLAQHNRDAKPLVDMVDVAPRPESDDTDESFVYISQGLAALGRCKGKRSQENDNARQQLHQQQRPQYGWDNEFGDDGKVVVHVNAFHVAKNPVTVGQFAAFVAAGGYANADLWEETDWQWRAKQGVEHPASWKRRVIDTKRDECASPAVPSQQSTTRSILKNFELIGALTRSRDLEAVQHVPVFCSLAEARAFAKWKNCRLPSEAEWQRMAYGRRADASKVYTFSIWPCANGSMHPVPGQHGNLGFHRSLPCPVGSFPAGDSDFGVSGLLGDGWELTSSEFQPLPGFLPSPHYPNYSSDFFDGKHFVLKGASWATDPRLVRPSFRNWYQFNYPYVFAKFRLVRERASSETQ